MNLYDFNRLTEAERAEHVFHFGNFLANCPDRGNLYDMGKFYAEVLYNDDTNEIKQVRSFSTLRNLEPYLAHIKIDAGTGSSDPEE